MEGFAPRNKLLIYFLIITITVLTRYRQRMREGSNKTTPLVWKAVVRFYFLKAVVVSIGENAAIIVCMKLRNCGWAAGPRTMNQLLIRASTSFPQWQLRTVLWLQTYKDATTLLPFRRKSAVHNRCHMAFLYASSGRPSLKTHGRPHCILRSVFANRNYYWRTSRWRMSHSVDRFCCQRWATKSINNACVRFVMSVCPPVSAYLKAIRVVSFEFLMCVTDSL